MNTLAIYNRMPIWAQNVLCNIQGKILNRQRYGGDYVTIYNSLLDSDKWTKEQIMKYKEANIFRIIDYAYNHTRFYRSFFDEYGIKPADFKNIEDLKKFPILTKELVREHWRDMISDEFKESDLIPYHTSGSTGKALDFYWTKHSLRFYWATVWRGRARFGIKRGDLHLNFTGKIVVPLSQSRPPYWRYNKALNQYMLNMQHITAEKITYLVDFINKTRAKFFVGYPSIIHSLALLIEEVGLKITAPPKYIFSSAEKMYDFQRVVIERVFKGVKIVEHYGFSENAASASKHIDDLYREDFELGHLELNDAKQVEGSQTGTMLATGFQNLCMPFIRYEIGDTATFADGKSGSQIITDIEGRNGDFVITPEGARIMRFGYIFKQSRWIKECQIVQNQLGEMVVRAIIRNGCNITEFESSTIKAIREWISPTIDIRFEYVDNIPRTKAGKFKAVISTLNAHS